MSRISNLILIALEDNDGEIHGTEDLASLLGVPANKSWLRRHARTIPSIQIIPSHGGRGNKTIYRRNRNSPGYPRKP